MEKEKDNEIKRTTRSRPSLKTSVKRRYGRFSLRKFSAPASPNQANEQEFEFVSSQAKETLGKTHSVGPTCSPITDTPKRNAVLSRKHYYGSTEMLCNPRQGREEESNHFRSPLRFRVENGETDNTDVVDEVELYADSVKGSMVHLENPEWQTRWYFKYFLGRLHQNYIGLHADKNPFILSVCVTDEDNYGVLQYRTILWQKMGSERRCTPYDPGKPLSSKTILQICYDVRIEKGLLKEISDPEIQKELLVLEDQEGSVNFKFGVIFAKQGQITDDEILSNEKESESFDRFLRLLGDRIPLRGWTKFRGGLDVKCNMTGSTSVHTHYEGHEIMFHVSTLLPHSDDPQQVERKRHIGNDIVNIVFQECEDHARPTFTPYGVRSQFTHIYALVTYSNRENSYRITVFSEVSVPAFGPPLPSTPVFKNPQEFRDFLLVKMINGEKATHLTPTFSKRRHRTLEMLLNNLANTHLQVEKPRSRKFTNTLYDSRTKQVKENERQEKFISFGKKLKLNLIQPEVPARLVSSSLGVTRSEPWETQCICNYFPTKVTCGDSWGDVLILGTEEGVFKLDGGTMRQLFDKTVDVKQLYVDEEHGLLLLRADRGRDGKICIFPLSDFEEHADVVAKSKVDCKNHKLDKAKGAHLLSISRNIGCRCFAVASSRKVQLYKWKNVEHRKPSRIASNFEIVKEVVVIESPCLMTVVDCGNDGYSVCVGYRSQFDLIDMNSGKITKFHDADTTSSKNKSNLISAIDVYEEEGPALLLSYNHISFFKLLNGEHSSKFNFQWNATPQSIVYVFPYIMAFTRNTIEIRLVVNGTLVHTLVLPRVHLIASKDDIHFASSHAIPRDNLQAASDLTKRYTNVKYRDTQETHSSSSEQQIRIYKMPLSSIQKVGLDRSPRERLPCIRTPVSPFGEAPFDFPSPVAVDGKSIVEEDVETRPKSNMSNLSRPFSWAVLDDPTRLDAEFRDLIECHQGEINCL